MHCAIWPIASSAEHNVHIGILLYLFDDGGLPNSCNTVLRDQSIVFLSVFMMYWATHSARSSPVLERRSNSFSQQSVDHSPVPSAQAPSWLDYAKIRYGGSHHDAAVEDVKRLGIILILFICLLPYWLVFFQVHYSWNNEMLILFRPIHSSILSSVGFRGVKFSVFLYTSLFIYATINFWYKRRTGALHLLLYVTF